MSSILEHLIAEAANMEVEQYTFFMMDHLTVDKLADLQREPHTPKRNPVAFHTSASSG